MTDDVSDRPTLDPRFIGTWKLVSVSREEVATGAPLDIGVHQTGYVTYTAEGRVTLIIAREEAHKPQPVIIAYTAKWSVKGDRVMHEVDIATRLPWVGTQQLRHFVFEGNKLILSPPVSADFTHGKVTRRSLEWEKIEAA